MGREDFQTVLKKIRKTLVPDGIFGLIMQEGRGDVQFPEPLCPGKSSLVCLYSIKELTEILGAQGFSVIALKRRGSVSKLEYPYKKLLLVSQADRGHHMPLARPPSNGKDCAEDLIEPPETDIQSGNCICGPASHFVAYSPETIA